MTVKERIKFFINHSDIKQSEFETRIGAQNGYVNGIRKSIGAGYLKAIEREFPNVNTDWLLYGEGEMLNTQIAPSKDLASYDIDTVPLIPDEAIAGFPGALIEGVNYFDCRQVRSPFPGAEIAIQVSGDSMIPDIKSGDRLYLRKIDENAFIPWGHSVVLDTVNGAVVKEIQPCPNDEDSILAISTNSKYPPYKIGKSSINGIYKILGSITINSTF